MWRSRACQGSHTACQGRHLCCEAVAANDEHLGLRQPASGCAHVHPQARRGVRSAWRSRASSTCAAQWRGRSVLQPRMPTVWLLLLRARARTAAAPRGPTGAAGGRRRPPAPPTASPPRHPGPLAASCCVWKPENEALSTSEVWQACTTGHQRPAQSDAASGRAQRQPQRSAAAALPRPMALSGRHPELVKALLISCSLSSNAQQHRF